MLPLCSKPSRSIEAVDSKLLNMDLSLEFLFNNSISVKVYKN